MRTISCIRTQTQLYYESFILRVNLCLSVVKTGFCGEKSINPKNVIWIQCKMISFLCNMILNHTIVLLKINISLFDRNQPWTGHRGCHRGTKASVWHLGRHRECCVTHGIQWSHGSHSRMDLYILILIIRIVVNKVHM